MDPEDVVAALLILVVEYADYINHPERFDADQARGAVQEILHRILELTKLIVPPLN
jgi:hypothetical protein